MFSIERRKKKCKYCGEAFDGYSTRCPYCGSLQKVKSKKVKVEGEGFILLGDDTDTRDGPKGKATKSGDIGNPKKVLLAVVCAAVPGLGQIAGAIAGLVYMDSANEDRRSFGKALFIASIVMFVISGIAAYLTILAVMTVPL